MTASCEEIHKKFIELCEMLDLEVVDLNFEERPYINISGTLESNKDWSKLDYKTVDWVMKNIIDDGAFIYKNKRYIILKDKYQKRPWVEEKPILIYI